MKRVSGFHDAVLTGISWSKEKVQFTFENTEGCEDLVVRGQELVVWAGGEVFPSIVSGIAISSLADSELSEEKKTRLADCFRMTKRNVYLFIYMSCGEDVVVCSQGDFDIIPPAEEYGPEGPVTS